MLVPSRRCFPFFLQLVGILSCQIENKIPVLRPAGMDRVGSLALDGSGNALPPPPNPGAPPANPFAPAPCETKVRIYLNLNPTDTHINQPFLQYVNDKFGVAPVFDGDRAYVEVGESTKVFRIQSPTEQLGLNSSRYVCGVRNNSGVLANVSFYGLGQVYEGCHESPTDTITVEKSIGAAMRDLNQATGKTIYAVVDTEWEGRTSNSGIIFADDLPRSFPNLRNIYTGGNSQVQNQLLALPKPAGAGVAGVCLPSNIPGIKLPGIKSGANAVIVAGTKVDIVSAGNVLATVPGALLTAAAIVTTYNNAACRMNRRANEVELKVKLCGSPPTGQTTDQCYLAKKLAAVVARLRQLGEQGACPEALSAWQAELGAPYAGREDKACWALQVINDTSNLQELLTEIENGTADGPVIYLVLAYGYRLLMADFLLEARESNCGAVINPSPFCTPFNLPAVTGSAGDGSVQHGKWFLVTLTDQAGCPTARPIVPDPYCSIDALIDLDTGSLYPPAHEQNGSVPSYGNVSDSSFNIPTGGGTRTYVLSEAQKKFIAAAMKTRPGKCLSDITPTPTKTPTVPSMSNDAIDCAQLLDRANRYFAQLLNPAACADFAKDGRLSILLTSLSNTLATARPVCKASGVAALLGELNDDIDRFNTLLNLFQGSDRYTPAQQQAFCNAVGTIDLTPKATPTSTPVATALPTPTLADPPGDTDHSTIIVPDPVPGASGGTGGGSGGQTIQPTPPALQNVVAPPLPPPPRLPNQ